MLGLDPAGDEAGVPQDLQVLRDRGLADVERVGQLAHVSFAVSQLVEYPTPGRVGHHREGVGHHPDIIASRPFAWGGRSRRMQAGTLRSMTSTSSRVASRSFSLWSVVVAVDSMTAADYLATPEGRPGSEELICGTVVVNEPQLIHMRAQQEVHFALMTCVRAGRARGMVGLPADVRIDDSNVFAPDVWWVAEERKPGPGSRLLDGVPDLVVEVRSPSTWARDLGVKLPAYEAARVPEAWFVDTAARSVLVFRRSGAVTPTFDIRFEVSAEDDLVSPMLSDFTLNVATLFAD